MKQNEIWLINLDPTIGTEIKKTRPAIIVNDNVPGKLPLKIVVPVSEWKEKYSVAPWMVKINANVSNGQKKDSGADCFQLRSVSQKRFVNKIGKVLSEILDQIKVDLTKVFSIEID